MNILRRLSLWIRWRRFDADMRDELECHRAEIERVLEAEGMRPADAARESRRQIGNVTLAREDARDVWIWRWLDLTRQDVTYAVRGMRRAPVFSLTAVLTLALAIG
ncbi:MAG: permease prefix domain 1-containing protein, partial [Vicinamibacterales bacterium]